MLCPFCKSENLRVVETRESGDTDTRRRRECESCHRRFTTYEHISNQDLKVVKKNGCVEPFDRQKIINGIEKACNKRPITRDQIETIADDIEMEVFENGRGEITTRKIGDMVMERLMKLDEVAYMRFASVCKAFKDVTEFKDELKNLKKVGDNNGAN